MAGCGSSFSQSRRPGWENAYVDYETLKLLLTHIELVYEQSNYDFHQSEEYLESDVSKENDGQRTIESSPFISKYSLVLDGKASSLSTNSKKNHRRRRSSLHPSNRKKYKKTPSSDYRDQLFIESDSSDAFAMNSSDNESNEKVAHPSPANFAFDTKGLLYDLDLVSIHNDVETAPIFNGNIHSYQATGYHVDRSSSRNIVQEAGGMYWAPFTSSQKDNLTSNEKLKTENKKSSPVNRSIKNRWSKKRRVPSHIQMAHAKARAITKRFLGLLSAEVEKVSLFVHARLGELADTMGSLRFANDEGDALGRSDNEYPLSDGGFHSSSSSSNGSIYSSDGDDVVTPRLSFENPLHSPNIEPNISSSVISSKQRIRRKKSAQSSRRDMEMRHERLRQSKPLFQRSDAVFGEDLSLLSAVDEADGYATVGVEIIHLFRFIMVNTLAVRKLCVKHDRLLANRMLGGYHHMEVKRLHQNDHLEYSMNADSDQPRKTSIRKDSISEYNDYSTHVHGKAFADYRRDLSLRLQSNQNKLVGIFDSKLQELMTSATSMSLSESMSRALYEYEVSMCRARALSNLNGSQKKLRTKTQKLPLDESAFCYYFPTPRFSFRTKYKENKPLSLSQDDDSANDDDDDDDSTASTSTISLIRLRFVVASILGWQEASRVSQSQFQSFLARTMLLYDSHGHAAGDRLGFYGSSRGTLDWLMSYNADLPLVIDDYKHMLRALQSSQLDDLMLTCLAVGSGSRMDKHDTLNEFHAIAFKEKVFWNDNFLFNFDYISKRFLLIALSSSLVSTMNIYIIVPSAFSSASVMGKDFIASLMLIGSSTVGALCSLLVQSYFISSMRNDNLLAIDGSSCVANLFCLIGVIGIIGNGIFTYAISKSYYIYAIAGRVLVGATFCEPLCLFVASNSVTISRRAAVAVYLKASSMIGMTVGLLMGSFNTNPFNIILDGYEISINSETIGGLILFFLWTLLFGSVINLCISMPKRVQESAELRQYPVHESNRQTNIDSPGSSDCPYHEEGAESEIQGLVPFRKLHQLREDSENTIGRFDWQQTSPAISNVRVFMANWNRAIKIAYRSTSLPVCFFLIVITSAITEMILNSFPLTMSHHFGWNFSLSGLYITALSAVTFPSYGLVYFRTEVSEERALMKNCLVLLLWGTLSLTYFPNACTFITKSLSQNQPEFCGITTIISILLGTIGSFVTYFGCNVIQHVTLSVISKTSTSKLNRNPINCGTLKIVALLIGKLFGNVLLLFIWIIYRLTGLDYMNSIAFSFVMMLALGYRRVKKNYFFLSS